MNLSFFKIVLLCSSILLVFQACWNQTDKIIEENTSHAAFDTSIFVKHWEEIPKKFEGIDSISAWEFFWNNNILVNKFYDFRTCKKIKILKKDLTKNGVEDIFITLNENGSFLYQRTKQGKWEEIWEGYEDGGGAPELILVFGEWTIESDYFMSCSNCSDDGLIYSKIYQDSVIDICSLAWGYSYDHENDVSDYYIYEECGGIIDSILENQLIIKYDIALSEVESDLIFLKDTTVKITYEWADYRLLIKDVFPQKLKPYVLKWHEKLEQDREDFGYSLNGEVLLGYIDFKKTTLLQLKNNQKYQAVIKELEFAYKMSWKELIESWSLEHSFASPL